MQDLRTRAWRSILPALLLGAPVAAVPAGQESLAEKAVSMPRRARQLQSNVVYHLYNRRNEKQQLFPDDDAYAAFLTLVKKALHRVPVRLHAYCLMQTHWHFAASAERADDISAWMAWLLTTHAIRFRRDTMTVGLGHVYQGRFNAVPADDIVHYVRLIKYIERNPLECGAVSRAEDWKWSSLVERGDRNVRQLIQPGPWNLPADWLDIVNTPDVQIELLPSLLGQVRSFRPEPISFH